MLFVSASVSVTRILSSGCLAMYNVFSIKTMCCFEQHYKLNVMIQK